MIGTISNVGVATLNIETEHSIDEWVTTDELKRVRRYEIERLKRAAAEKVITGEFHFGNATGEEAHADIFELLAEGGRPGD